MQIKDKPNNYEELQDLRSGGNMNSNTLFKDFVFANLRIDRSWNILDIGCRQGYILNELWKKGCKNVYGIDIGLKAEASWVNLPFRKNLIRSDIHDGVPFEIDFDLITCSHTLEHCYDPEKVRKIIKGHLNPEGLLHSIIPIEKNEEYFADYPYHLIMFESHKEHIDFYRKNGFELVYDRFDGDNSIGIFRKI